MQTVDELKYSQSVWGFQPRKAEIRKVCDVKGLLRNRNHLDVGKDRFRQRCQIVPLVRTWWRRSGRLTSHNRRTEAA